MLTVNYVYASGREEQITVAATYWRVITTLETYNMLKDFGIVGIEIIKYQPE
jgi:hypothetical protein